MAQRIPKALTARRRRAAWLVGLWFAIGLQPCAVAALSVLECPHCPSRAHGGDDELHAHHGAGHDAHGEHGAARYAEPGEPDCRSDASDCCELDDAAFDGRGTASFAKDLGDAGDMPVVAPPPYLTYAPGDEARPDPPDPRHTPYRGVRLHVINCVYLD